MKAYMTLYPTIKTEKPEETIAYTNLNQIKQCRNLFIKKDDDIAFLKNVDGKFVDDNKTLDMLMNKYGPVGAVRVVYSIHERLYTKPGDVRLKETDHWYEEFNTKFLPIDFLSEAAFERFLAEKKRMYKFDSDESTWKLCFSDDDDGNLCLMIIREADISLYDPYVVESIASWNKRNPDPNKDMKGQNYEN